MNARSTIKSYVKTAELSGTTLVREDLLFLFHFALRFLRVAALLAIWRGILGKSGPVSGLTLGSILTYTLISEVFADLLACRTWLEMAFWDGSITVRFLRPISIFSQFAAEAAGWWAFNLLVFSLPLLLAAPLMGVNPLPASASAGGLFIVSLILAVMVGLAVDYIFAGVAVALEFHPYTINSARAAIGSLLSGAVIPLALLPWGLGSVLAWLPFASMASAPLRIYTGAATAWQLIAIQAVWVVALWPMVHKLWNANREKMVTVGG
jgi:ABC-2 type transport system permease protein